MIVIVDYRMGNLGSIRNMLKKVGAESAISSDPDVIAAADKLILPGVGAFDHGMANLEELGLIPALRRRVLGDGVPCLGICLGMQLLSQSSEEGKRPGLGWIDARTVRLRCDTDGAGLRVPHMGWNVLRPMRPHPLLDDLGPEPRFYFVHSYHVRCTDPEDVLGVADYGGPVTAAVGRGNVLGTQFHPEKSHKFGMALLRNFAAREAAAVC